MGVNDKRYNQEEYDLRLDVAKNSMDILYNQFVKNPGADQWNRLKNAMGRYQELIKNTKVDELAPWTEENREG